MNTSKSLNIPLPFYILLLPAFFTLHGWNQSFNLVTLSGFVYSLFILCGIVLFILLICVWAFKDQAKAFLFCFLVSSLLLFLPYSSLTGDPEFQSSSTLTVKTVMVFIFFLILFILFRKTKKNFSLGVKFIKVLLCVIFGFEIILFLINSSSAQTVKIPPFIKSNQVVLKENMPSVFVILLDEYAGKESLETTAKYNNSKFTNELTQLGFRVINNAKSNYNHTIFSVSSFLNGHYVSFKKPIYSNNNYKPASYEISNNRAVATFKELGYNIVNLSPFNFRNELRYYKSFSLPTNGDLILRPTIFDDIFELGPLYISRRLPDKSLFEKMVEEKIKINTDILEQLVIQSKLKSTTPVFYYAHLMMPHAMYAKDSSGKVNLQFLTKKQITTEDKQQAYLQYLVYTNKTVIPYLRKLKKNTGDSAIILLLSDHGSRDFITENSYKNSFSSLAAVYSPIDSGKAWYDGITNVNQFRVLFSTITGYKLPLLKDSLIIE